MSVLDVALWPVRQLIGFSRNLWTWLTEQLSLRDVTLPAVYGSLLWLSNQVPMALGGGSAGDQIEASFVLSVATFVTGFVTGGLAWALIVVWVLTGVLGVVRFVPAVGDRWPVPEWRIGDRQSLGVL